MLNFKQLIIFCVLLSSFWVHSSETNWESVVDANFAKFTASLAGRDGNSNQPYNVTIRPNSLTPLPRTSYNFKIKCCNMFARRLATAGANAKSLLEQIGYEVLDDACKETLEKLQKYVKHDRRLWFNVRDMVGDENILDFLAFVENPGIGEDKLNEEIKQLGKKKKKLNVSELRYTVILNKYDKGPFHKYPPGSDKTGMQKMIGKLGKALAGK